VVKSSLEDIQSKYDKATEEVALLQAELASSETLRIENQRLKDELRDLREEYAILKEKQAQPPDATQSPARNHTPPSPPISESRANTPNTDTLSPPKPGPLHNLGGVGGTGTWRGVRRGVGKRLSIASDVSWASEARQTSSVKIMHDMVSRVKVFAHEEYANCRTLKHVSKHVGISSTHYSTLLLQKNSSLHLPKNHQRNHPRRISYQTSPADRSPVLNPNWANTQNVSVPSRHEPPLAPAD